MIDYQIFATASGGGSSCFAYAVKTEERAKELLAEIDLDALAEYGFTDFRIEPIEVADDAYDSMYSFFEELKKVRF